MIIILKQNAPEQQVQALCDELKARGLQIHASTGSEARILGLVGDTIMVSGGRIGLQIQLAPADLLAACGGKLADLCAE